MDEDVDERSELYSLRHVFWLWDSPTRREPRSAGMSFKLSKLFIQ